MIIRELHIDSFEGLSSRTFPLADGINVICGPNESGKSSLADFIFFMFYGVVSRTDAQHFPSLETGRATGSLLAELSDEESKNRHSAAASDTNRTRIHPSPPRQRTSFRRRDLCRAESAAQPGRDCIRYQRYRHALHLVCQSDRRTLRRRQGSRQRG